MSHSTKGLVSLAAASVLAVLAPAYPADAYDRPGRFEIVSVASDGSQGSGPSGADGCSRIDPPSLSSNGRFVAFMSTAPNLDPRDRNGVGPDIFVHDRKKKTTEIVSIGNSGLIPSLDVLPTSLCGPRGSYDPSISADGRFVAFTSDVPTLVPGDSNVLPDVFVRDRKAGTTRIASVASDGTPSDGFSGSPSISGTGRYIAFESMSSTFVDEPVDCTTVLFLRENCANQVYIHDLKLGKTILASVNDEGLGADYDAGYPGLSHDGTLLVFTSHAGNLAPNDTGVCPTAPRRNCRDVFLRDLEKKTTELISVAVDGGSGRNDSYLFEGSDPKISKDGRYVSFDSNASNLVPNDNGGTDHFVRDRKLDRTERISVSSYGRPFGGGNLGAISGNGRFVTFAGFTEEQYGSQFSRIGVQVHDRLTGATEDFAANAEGEVTNPFLGSIDFSGRFVTFLDDDPSIVPGDENGTWDIFVRDRGGHLGTVMAAGSERAGGTITGRIGRSDPVERSILTPGDLIGARIVERPLLDDLYVRLDLRHLEYTPGIGGDGNLVYGISFMLGSSRFELRAASGPSSALDTDGGDFVLVKCVRELCSDPVDLQGSYGTTGHAITISVPRSMLGDHQGGLMDPMAFSGIGTLQEGASILLDRVLLTPR